MYWNFVNVVNVRMLQDWGNGYFDQTTGGWLQVMCLWLMYLKPLVRLMAVLVIW